MKILESPLMGEFIGYLKSTWSGNSRVSQRRRRLRQLVAMVRGVADAAEGRAVRSSSLNRWLELLRNEALRGQAALDATSDPSAVVGSARKFVAGLKTLFVCSAEVDRLTDAVEALERLAGPGADLDIFLKTLQLDAAANAMDVDGPSSAFVAARYRAEQGSYSVSAAGDDDDEMPMLGVKRKRVGGCSGVEQAGAEDGDGEGEAASCGGGGERVVVFVDRACRHKRRALACRRHAAGAGAAPAAAVAVAMARVRRRIGRPDIGRRLSSISLQ
ncbi:uncharacterized protein LOC100834092 [Brachypodium distachyon]|uniref:Rx N-terminal domain-containing protein n=1 Tax=Brachypodium distachyon TaxID=15368 RepID=I1HCB4_BRADI|nr:uncharacterized protein LOC100834092 [Brachypodium distachyon]KQK02846.1 hypothetical protein BRADI_2g04060v3 [Brachypodium distachyon]|eukprot:XP_014754352.1 uncharacterized protein LOC100834092 [Brachypodium distachyon]